MSVTDISDLLVIGGGISGISAARVWLDVHPRSKVVVLERDNTVGGVWSRERVYRGFRAQGSTRVCGFSDVPFSAPKEKIDPSTDHYEARCMADYLDDYVKNHVYEGKSLWERFRFGSIATRLEKVGGIWSIQYQDSTGQTVVVNARKLIVSTGSTSEANIPKFPNREAFKGRIIHTRDLAKASPYEDASVKKVTVVGAGKSAADMVYESVKAGKEVSWLIRVSGKGPGGFMTAKVPGKYYRDATELVTTRWMGEFVNPNGLGKETWWAAFLFKTILGSWLLRILGWVAAKQLHDLARYDDRPGARDSFKALKTSMNPLWLTAPAGMIHHDDFWDTVARNVDVYREDIESLSENHINLANGHRIKGDAILCGTGWKTSIPFLTEQQAIELGIPHDSSSDTSSEANEWTFMEDAASIEVLKRFPHLAHPPDVINLGSILKSHTPFRMYNTIAPLSDIEDHSIAFTGFATIPNMFVCAEVSAMWATAYLDGTLTHRLPTLDEMKRDVAYTNAYQRLRNPSYGRLGNFYIFDMYFYLDRLFDEMEVKSWKAKGWWDYWIRSLLVKNLVVCREEYLEKYAQNE